MRGTSFILFAVVVILGFLHANAEPLANPAPLANPDPLANADPLADPEAINLKGLIKKVASLLT
uniref:Eumenitin VP1 n=1 Tax=Eumenes pomiformis TaxID=693051 RepID=EUME1_EUMPO|nr:RecName: Full=Eumenitin VP1; AltName: Full=Venom peptide 1; Short=EpVP1; Short=VP1; Flags: Precursor [Eumenes pomiformis]ACZ37392.1 VP1 protein precursor [Eumenes pomiformis]